MIEVNKVRDTKGKFMDAVQSGGKFIWQEAAIEQKKKRSFLCIFYLIQVRLICFEFCRSFKLIHGPVP